VFDHLVWTLPAMLFWPVIPERPPNGIACDLGYEPAYDLSKFKKETALVSTEFKKANSYYPVRPLDITLFAQPSISKWNVT